MDDNYFIDKNDFRIYEEYPTCFNCDKEISVAVANLNKLGYKTKASCAGHYRPGCLEQRNVDLSFLERAKNDKHFVIREIREDVFDCWIENMKTSIYIAFDKKFVPKILPEGFKLFNEVDFDYASIEHDVDYYQNDVRKSDKVIEEEIKKYQEILNNWASNLPKREED